MEITKFTRPIYVRATGDNRLYSWAGRGSYRWLKVRRLRFKKNGVELELFFDNRKAYIDLYGDNSGDNLEFKSRLDLKSSLNWSNFWRSRPDLKDRMIVEML